MKTPQLNSPAHLVRGVPVNGQSVLPFSDEALGLSDYRRAGCSPIAVYNALVLLGIDRSLGEVADQFFCGPCGCLLFGLWGCAPWQIRRFLRRTPGCEDFRAFRSAKDLDSSLTDGSIVIFTMMNHRWNPFHAFHTMTAEKRGASVVIYNVSGRGTEPVSYPCLSDKLQEGRLLAAFVLQKK